MFSVSSRMILPSLESVSSCSGPYTGYAGYHVYGSRNYPIFSKCRGCDKLKRNRVCLQTMMEFSFSFMLMTFWWCLEKIEQRRRYAFETPYSPDINWRISENLSSILKFKLFEIVHEINYGYIRTPTLKKSCIDIISNFENIPRHRWLLNLCHPTVNKLPYNRFWRIKAKRSWSTMPRFKPNPILHEQRVILWNLQLICLSSIRIQLIRPFYI